MPMPMSKPPIIENRLSCSPSDNQSVFVNVGLRQIVLKNSKLFWMGNLSSMSRVSKFCIRVETRTWRSLLKFQLVSLHSKCREKFRTLYLFCKKAGFHFFNSIGTYLPLKIQFQTSAFYKGGTEISSVAGRERYRTAHNRRTAFWGEQ